MLKHFTNTTVFQTKLMLNEFCSKNGLEFTVKLGTDSFSLNSSQVLKLRYWTECHEFL